MTIDQQSDLNEIYVNFGQALCFAQILEHGLKISNIFADVVASSDSNGNEADFDPFTDKYLKNTMGQLVLKLKERTTVPTESEQKLVELNQLLLESVTLRNYLAHRFFFDRMIDTAEKIGREKMIQELKSAQKLFLRADALLAQVARGVSGYNYG